jgi:hypothetical protein
MEILFLLIESRVIPSLKIEKVENNMRFLRVLLILIIISCSENVDTEFYANGNVKKRWHSEGDVKVLYIYFQNGNLKERSEWKAGNRHGATIRYDSLGRKVSEASFEGGMADGYVIFYSPAEKVRAKFTWV